MFSNSKYTKKITSKRKRRKPRKKQNPKRKNLVRKKMANRGISLIRKF